MSRVIAIVGHGVLLAVVVLGILIDAGAALGVLVKLVQLVLLAGCVGSIVVLARGGGAGRTAVVTFNTVLLLFAVSSVVGLLYYQFQYGGQPLIAGLLSIGLVALPPLASLLALRGYRSKPVAQ
jgi:hypothetical protein